MEQNGITLAINAKEYLTEFLSLNEAWITQYFKLEEADYQIAKDPESIIDDGGYIFSLLKNNEVIGVCALFHLGANEYQLARMAVNKAYHGNGYGNLLMEAALDQLKALQVKKVTLLSNTALVAAISLYKKYGYTVTSTGPHPVYSRVDIVMEKSFTWPSFASDQT